MPPRSRNGPKTVDVADEDTGKIANPASLKRGLTGGCPAEELAAAASPRGGRRAKKSLDTGMHDTLKGRVQAAGQDGEGDGGPYEAVVKVFATHCEPNYRQVKFCQKAF